MSNDNSDKKRTVVVIGAGNAGLTGLAIRAALRASERTIIAPPINSIPQPTVSKKDLHNVKKRLSFQEFADPEDESLFKPISALVTPPIFRAPLDLDFGGSKFYPKLVTADNSQGTTLIPRNLKDNDNAQD